MQMWQLEAYFQLVKSGLQLVLYLSLFSGVSLDACCNEHSLDPPAVAGLEESRFSQLLYRAVIVLAHVDLPYTSV